RPRDGGVRDRPRALGAARRPLRALQPHDALLVGCGGGAARRRHGGLPRVGALRDLEDDAAVREGGSGGRRVPPLAAPRVPRPSGHDAPPPSGRRLTVSPRTANTSTPTVHHAETHDPAPPAEYRRRQFTNREGSDE